MSFTAHLKAEFFFVIIVIEKTVVQNVLLLENQSVSLPTHFFYKKWGKNKRSLNCIISKTSSKIRCVFTILKIKWGILKLIHNFICIVI